MVIAMVTPIIFDPSSPFNHLLRDILEGYLSDGHQIIRIVATESMENNDYKMGLETKQIQYIPYLRKKINKANIISRYLSDMKANFCMARILKKIKADVLFEDISYSSICSVLVAKKKKMRIVSMSQDVWPDNAVQSGLMSEKSIVYKYFDFIQRKVFCNSQKIICISEDMKAFLIKKRVEEDRICVVYNWGYTDDRVKIAWEDNQFVQKYSLDSQKFYAIYAGNIGRMQNVELVVKAAEILIEKTNIHFLIIGSGVKAEAINDMVKKKALTNVTLLPMQPSEMAVDIYSAAGINVIPLVANGIKTALPSKTGVALSCGKPIVCCFGRDCLFGEQVEQMDAGACVSAVDATALANVILKYSKLPREYCGGAWTLFEQDFSRFKNINTYKRIMVETMKQFQNR